MSAGAIEHKECCTRAEVEHYAASRPDDGAVVQVARCVGCGAVTAEVSRPPRLEPESPEWRQAWRQQPGRLVRELLPDEVGNPLRNPRHPLAQSTPPGATPPPRLQRFGRRSWPAFPPVGGVR